MLLRHSISSAAFAALSQSLLIAAPSVAKETSKYSTQLIFSAEYANIGEECDDFTSKAPRDAVTYHEVSTSADVGILKCDMSSVCLPDTTSSRGGRCTQSSSTTRARVLRPESKTILESPTNNTCSKCVGTEACAGLSAEFIDNNIGCGSCIEAFSCRNLNETGSKIGVGSCVGYKSCEGISAIVGDYSCTNEEGTVGKEFGYSCSNIDGVVGDGSCIGYSSCYQYQIPEGPRFFTIGNQSCRSDESCEYMYFGTESVGSYSCNSEFACYTIDANVGSNSCNAERACFYIYEFANIENESCNAHRACLYNNALIGSCNW